MFVVIVQRDDFKGVRVAKGDTRAAYLAGERKALRFSALPLPIHADCQPP